MAAQISLRRRLLLEVLSCLESDTVSPPPCPSPVAPASPTQGQREGVVLGPDLVLPVVRQPPGVGGLGMAGVKVRVRAKVNYGP